MKKKKRAVIATAVIAGILPIVLLSVFIFFNDILLGNMTRSFRREIRKSEAAVELLEVKSVCGKLNGNGNGMNYFGAALMTADSAEDMETLTAALEREFETVGYVIQEGTQVDVPHLEHRKLFFDDINFRENETYYCVWFYIHEHPNSNIFDLRGY